MNSDMLPLPNYAEAVTTILKEVGADELWAHYPGLRPIDERIAAGPAGGADAERGLAIELFGAIRANFPEEPGRYDQTLIRSARLDLHASRLEDAFRDFHGHNAPNTRLLAAIGSRMNIPFETANYLCHLSNTRKYLYVATPKVACTLIKHCLQQAEMDGKLVYRHYGEEHVPAVSPLLSPRDNPQHFIEATESEDWFRFTFVRDPFNRVLSCYLDKVIKARTERDRLLPLLGFDPEDEGPSFGEFLRAIERQKEEERDIHWAAQSWLTRPALMNYHFIGRLENFTEDFQHVCDRLGIDQPQYPNRHATHADQKLGAHYGPEEIALVKAIYADDFTDFGYDPERLAPAGASRAGDC
jgi:hypothetical protein